MVSPAISKFMVCYLIDGRKDIRCVYISYHLDANVLIAIV